MTSTLHPLLFVQPVPVATNITEYFLQFNYNVTYQPEFPPTINRELMPEAVVVDSALIRSEQDVHNFYEQYPIAIIVLHEEQDEALCIRLLEAGADDFMVKPIHLRELHARINVIARRVTDDRVIFDDEIFQFDDWHLFLRSRRLVHHLGTEVPLSTGEFDMMLAFVRHPNEILSRDDLLHVQKEGDIHPKDRRVDVQISRLRQKIEIDPRHPELIKTIRNGGYMLTTDVTIKRHS